jgi:MFS family permease
MRSPLLAGLYCKLSSVLLCTTLLTDSYFPPTFNMKHPGERLKDYVTTFDYVGLFLFVGGLLIFLLGLSWGGSLHPWNSASVIATIVIGGVALIVFVAWEAKFAKEPLMPIKLFRNLRWVAIVLTLSMSVTVYYAFSIVWPQIVFQLYETDLIKGGLLCCVIGQGTNVGQLLSGLGRQFGNHRIQFLIGTIVGGAFLGGTFSDV